MQIATLSYMEKVKNDWRRQGQEKYLMNVKLIFQDYLPNNQSGDHDHCEFCWKKFSLYENGLKKGYSTLDYYHWICPDCYKDFKWDFKWDLEI